MSRTHPSIRDHWGDHAHQWSLITSPLRPCHDDVRLMQELLGESPGRGLLLGVTPELTSLSNNMLAVDHNKDMISRVSSCEAQIGEWQALPLESHSFDFAVGDGSLSVIPFSDYYSVLHEANRVLRPNQLLVLRLFISPEESESVTDVIAAIDSIDSFHAFKWRLAMAICAENGSPNIAVSHIYDVFEREIPHRDHLKWPRAVVDTINVYKHSEAIYSFPTLTQVRHQIAPIFAEHAIRYATYELAERCPIIALKAV